VGRWNFAMRVCCQAEAAADLRFARISTMVLGVVQLSRLITRVTKLRLVVAIVPVTSQQPGVGK
jgi:hypothetical protein